MKKSLHFSGHIFTAIFYHKEDFISFTVYSYYLGLKYLVSGDDMTAIIAVFID